MLLAACLLPATVWAQEVQDAPAAAPGDSPPTWSYDLEIYGFFVPDDESYVLAMLEADRGKLHLEARYNYEDLETVSFWAGYNVNVGARIDLEFTPMLGVVVGQTDGVAPSYLVAPEWWRLAFFTEGEWVYVPRDRDESFFQSWSELTLAPVRRPEVRLVGQRTKIRETAGYAKAGVLDRSHFAPVSIAAYAFDMNEDDAQYGLAVEIEF